MLAAAETEFGRVGFNTARLEDIAKAAGISRPSLLYHFSSKEKLYAQAVRRVFNKLGELFIEAIAYEGSFAERLDRAISMYAKFIDEHPAVARIVMRELLDGGAFARRIMREEILPLLQRVAQFIEKDGGALVPKGLPLGPVITQVAMGVMMRSASGELKDELWGDARTAKRIAFALLRIQ